MIGKGRQTPIGKKAQRWIIILKFLSIWSTKEMIVLLINKILITSEKFVFSCRRVSLTVRSGSALTNRSHACEKKIHSADCVFNLVHNIRLKCRKLIVTMFRVCVRVVFFFFLPRETDGHNWRRRRTTIEIVVSTIGTVFLARRLEDCTQTRKYFCDASLYNIRIVPMHGVYYCVIVNTMKKKYI